MHNVVVKSILNEWRYSLDDFVYIADAESWTSSARRRKEGKH